MLLPRRMSRSPPGPACTCFAARSDGLTAGKVPRRPEACSERPTHSQPEHTRFNLYARRVANRTRAFAPRARGDGASIAVVRPRRPTRQCDRLEDRGELRRGGVANAFRGPEATADRAARTAGGCDC